MDFQWESNQYYYIWGHFQRADIRKESFFMDSNGV